MSVFNRFPEELRDKIMDSCDVRTMTALASTSRYWDRKRGECIHFRVVNLLRYFRLEPRPFLDLLARTSSIISGSAALLIFLPGLFIPGDLDVYVREENLNPILDYFNTFTEYYSDNPAEKKRNASDNDYTTLALAANRITEVLRLCCSSPTMPVTVNIIVVKDASPIRTIPHFHSTPVMNIITGTGTLCMYPELTLRMRGIINTNKASLNGPNPSARLSKLNRCLDKYRERGFELALTLGKWPGLRPNFAGKTTVKDVPACVVAFPEVLRGLQSVGRVPKEVALTDEDWQLEWGLSEWSFP